MLLKNHVASRFLDNKDDLVMEILEHTHPDAFKSALGAAEKKAIGGSLLVFLTYYLVQLFVLVLVENTVHKKYHIW